jgi:hypothetical protein
MNDFGGVWRKSSGFGGSQVSVVNFGSPTVSNFAFLVGTNAGSADSNSVTTSAIDTTGATFIVVCVADYVGAVAGTVSDSKSNSWTPRTSYDDASFPRVRLYYSAVTSVGTGHTFTLTGSGNFPAIGVAAFSGSPASSPFDVENGGSGNNNAPSAGTGITPSQDNELIIAGVCQIGGTIDSINSSFNIVGSPIVFGGNTFGNGIAYLIQTTATAVDPDWHISNPGQWAATIASFKRA